MLEIADSGAGISTTDRENIFEPFFTTKDQGQGTGLGLAVSHGIVKDHDGWIEVESPPPGAPAGTVFRVYLPIGGGAPEGPWAETTGRDLRGPGREPASGRRDARAECAGTVRAACPSPSNQQDLTG